MNTQAALSSLPSPTMPTTPASSTVSIVSSASLSTSSTFSRFECRHASRGEYHLFACKYANTTANYDRLIYSYNHFIEEYPDLNAWFSAPLAERVGLLYGEDRSRPTNKVSFKARSYLMYLAVQGHARFDLEWILSIPVLRVWKLLDFVKLNLDTDRLIEEAMNLGYERCVRDELRYVMSRIFLHTGISQAGDITDEHLAEYLEAVHKLGERNDIALYFGSAERYP